MYLKTTPFLATLALLLSLTMTVYANQPVNTAPPAGLAGCNGQPGGCTLTLSHDPLPPPPIIENPNPDICGDTIAWQNSAPGADCYVNCGNYVTDPIRGHHVPFPGDTCDEAELCNQGDWVNTQPARCLAACGQPVYSADTAAHSIPFPWQNAQSSQSCFRDCGHPTRPWQNNSSSLDCHAACGAQVSDIYDGQHTPFPWQTSNAGERCFECGVETRWQNANPASTCHAGCGDTVSDPLNGAHVPFSFQDTDPNAICFTEPCGSPLNPWTYEDASDPARCKATCDEIVNDVFSGAHTPFTSQDDDPLAICYCGSANARQWQSTNPAASCYLPPCGTPTNPYQHVTEHPDTSCPLDCDEPAPDGTVWFPSQPDDAQAVCYVPEPACTDSGWQYDDPALDCYGCGAPPPDGGLAYQNQNDTLPCYLLCGQRAPDASGVPFTLTHPTCIADPTQCPPSTLTWTEDSNVCGPGIVDERPVGTVQTLSDATTPTIGTSVLICDAQPGGNPAWTRLAESCEVDRPSCPEEEFNWSYQWPWSQDRHDCGPATAPSTQRDKSYLLIDSEGPTTGEQTVLCIEDPYDPQGAIWFVFHRQCYTNDEDQFCGTEGGTWEENGVVCGPEAIEPTEIGTNTVAYDWSGNTSGHAVFSCDDTPQGPTYTEESSTCVARCPFSFQYWTVDGYQCQGRTGVGDDGDVVQATDTKGPTTGAATLTCQDDTWVPSGETCTGPDDIAGDCEGNEIFWQINRHCRRLHPLLRRMAPGRRHRRNEHRF